MNHLIDILQLSTQEIDELVEKAKDIIANPEAYACLLYTSDAADE